MKIKTFYGMDNDKLDNKVNDFLEKEDVEVLDIKLCNPLFYFTVMIMYKEK